MALLAVAEAVTGDGAARVSGSLAQQLQSRLDEPRARIYAAAIPPHTTARTLARNFKTDVQYSRQLNPERASVENCGVAIDLALSDGSTAHVIILVVDALWRPLVVNQLLLRSRGGGDEVIPDLGPDELFAIDLATGVYRILRANLQPFPSPD